MYLTYRKELSQMSNGKDKNNINNNYAFVSTVNNKRSLLLDKADTIINKLINDGSKNKISPSIFITIGYEKFTDSRYDESEKYYQYALNFSEKYKDKAAERVACSALGEVYMIKGSNNYNLDSGRRKFKQAIDTISYKMTKVIFKRDLYCCITRTVS